MYELRQTHPLFQTSKQLESGVYDYADDVLSGLSDIERMDSSNSMEDVMKEAASLQRMVINLQQEFDDLVAHIEELYEEIVWKEISYEDEDALQDYLAPALKTLLAEKINQ